MATILVVDDDLKVGALTARILREAGHAVLTAGDAEEAVRVLAHEPEPIDLLVTDFHMPGMNGDELALHLLEAHPASRVLIVSGSWPAVDERFPVLVKPYAPRDLLEKVRELLRGS